jgi:hypothetical protein
MQRRGCSTARTSDADSGSTRARAAHLSHRPQAGGRQTWRRVTGAPCGMYCSPLSHLAGAWAEAERKSVHKPSADTLAAARRFLVSRWRRKSAGNCKSHTRLLNINHWARGCRGEEQRHGLRARTAPWRWRPWSIYGTVPALSHTMVSTRSTLRLSSHLVKTASTPYLSVLPQCHWIATG